MLPIKLLNLPNLRTGDRINAWAMGHGVQVNQGSSVRCDQNQTKLFLFLGQSKSKGHKTIFQVTKDKNIILDSRDKFIVNR